MTATERIVWYFLLSLAAVLGGCHHTEDTTSTSQATSPAVEAPTLIFAASTNPNTISVEWSDASPNVVYDIHLSQIESFEPNSSTLRATAVGSKTVVAERLNPSTTYYIKVVASLPGHVPVLGINALKVRTPEKVISFKTGITVWLDRDVGISLRSADGNVFTYALAAINKIPPPGTYVTGTAAFGNAEAYVRRIVSTSISGNLLVAITEEPTFADLFGFGGISYAIAFPTNSITAVTPSQKAGALAVTKQFSDATECKSGNLTVIDLASLLPKVKSQNTSPPVFSSDVGFNALGIPYIEGAYTSHINYELRQDLDFEQGIKGECKKRIIETSPVTYSKIITVPTPLGPIPIPVVVGALIFVELDSSISSSKKFIFSWSAHEVANASINVRVSTPLYGTTIIPAYTSISRSIMPNFTTNTPDERATSIPTSDVEAEFGFGVRFGVNGLLGVGVGKFSSLKRIIALGFDFGPKASLKIAKSEGFLQRIQPFELTSAKAGLYVSAFVEMVVNEDIFFKGLEVSARQPFCEDECDYFKTPKLGVSVTPLALPNYRANASSSEGKRIESDVKTVKWHFYPFTPETQPAITEGFLDIGFQTRNSGCLAMSAADTLFGELGRRFTKIVAFGDQASSGPMIDFQSGGNLGPSSYVQDGYEFVGGTAKDGQFIVTPTSIRGGFLLVLSRRDKKPFTLSSFDAGFLFKDENSPGYAPVLLVPEKGGVQVERYAPFGQDKLVTVYLGADFVDINSLSIAALPGPDLPDRFLNAPLRMVVDNFNFGSNCRE